MRTRAGTILAMLPLVGALPALARQPVTNVPSRPDLTAKVPNGVVKPSRQVDPGMTVIKPTMPAGSTPVIKPQTTAPDGTVVVPR